MRLILGAFFAADGLMRPTASVLYSLSLCPKISHHMLDSKLVDDPHAFSRNFELYEALFALQPKPMLLNIRQKPAPCFVIGVRHIISTLGPLPCHLTYS